MDAQCSVCRRAVAKYICSCASAPLCAGCLVPHIDTEGTHIPTPVLKQVVATPSPQVQHNEGCDECHAKPAACFCLCAVPLRKYCEECDVAHYRKNPLLLHSEHPLSAFKPVSSGQVSLKTFNKKQQFINDLQLHLSLELVNFDAFVSQVADKFDNLLALVATKKETLMKDLQEQRGKLTEMLDTAQQTIQSKRYVESFEVNTEIDSLILTGYQSSVPPEITLFTGTVDLDKVIAALEKSITYEIACDVQQIPVITGASLKLYHPRTLRMVETTLAQATQIDEGTAYCYIRSDTLLCCGGTKNSGVCEVNVKKSSVERVASLNAVRAYTGLWKYRNGCVYAFGGQNYQEGYLNTAEAYSISGNTWSNLSSSLHAAKYLCSVCEHADNLYISGVSVQNTGWHYDSSLQDTIESFDPRSVTFTLLRTGYCQISSIICSNGDGLYCIWQNTIEQADLSNAPTVAFSVKANIPALGDGHYWLCCPMKWSGGELTSVLCNSAGPFGLFRFSPAKLQFTQVANLA